MTSKPNTPHVLIVGAGLGGLTLAQCLRKQGVTFEVFERDADANCRRQGWSIGLNRLEDIQSAFPDDVPSLRSCCHLLPLDLPSQIIFQSPHGRWGVKDTPETSCTRVERTMMREVLSTNIPVQWDKQAVKIEKTAKSVTVSFADGTSATGDILVGADGTSSAVREYVLGKSNSEILRPVPQAVIVGDTVVHDHDTLQRLLQLGHSAFIVPVEGGYLFNGLHRLSFGSSDSEKNGSSKDPNQAKLTAHYWFMHFWNAPDLAEPDFWLRTASQEEKYAYTCRAVASKDPRLHELVKLTGPEGIRKDYIMYWDAIIPELPVSRVTLLGDAAHPMTPFRGEGGIIAIKDALRLGQTLAKADNNDEAALFSALDEYQKEITERGVESITRSREQAGNFAKGHKGEKVEVRIRTWGYPMVPMPEKLVELKFARGIAV